jgi:hypothetical protein
MAADPSYPLLPTFCIICAALMLLVLTTSFIRQSWNLGVTFLCFWLFWELLTAGINAVIWSNNADIKLYVYCDISELPNFIHLPSTDYNVCLVSHLQLFTFVVKPACTLIITRRLYKIASLHAVEAPTRKEVGWRDSIAIQLSHLSRDIMISSLSGHSVPVCPHW